MKLKKIIPIAFILLIVAIIIMLIVSNKSSKETPPDSSPKFDLHPLDSSTNTPPLTKDGQVDTDSPEVQNAITQKTSLKEHLPIYIENYPTSANISTTINLYSLDDEPEYTVHLEIYEVIYHDQNYNFNENPNALAFKESFLAAKQTLQELGVDPTKLYYIYGSRKYIQETAELWVDKLELLK